MIDAQEIRVLVIRQENFQALSLALGALYRCPKKLFEIIDSNRTSDKAFHSTYCEAVSKIKFSREQLDAIYQTKYARHFYSEDEIAEFKAKWCA
ncbi:MAG TPA: hypothetical protein DDZ88_00105 [Verrucomicrobiales bacterium]|nr:hypothetical protein [Verrucomicrobiales bacterium]